MEAAFSLSCDYDCGNEVTVSGYAAMWGWSRKAVNKFLDDMGVEIVYPQNTKSKRNQRGHIGLHKRDIKGTYKGHKRMIDSNDIGDKGNIKGTYKEHKGDIKGSTTINPKNLNPNPKDNSFPENSNEFRLASFLLNHIRRNKPDFKQPNLQTWAKSADLMLRRDGRDLEKIKSVIEWSQEDEFWRGNVLSMSKLRKQFDALEIRMDSKNGTTKKPRSENYDAEFASLLD